MKKILFVFPIVVLLAAGCNSSQQATNQTPAPAPVVQNTNPAPATDATENWKTYSNVQYGYEIKYPAQQWLVKTANDTVNISLDRPNSESPTVQITVSNQTVAALAGQILADIKSDPAQKLISDKTGSFAGVVSKEIIYTPTAGGTITFVLLSKNGKTYQLSTIDTGEQNKDLDIILSTFKFTTAIVLDETVNWKTYSNSKYGFEIKYPINWQIVNNQDVGVNIVDPANPDTARMSVFAYTSDPEPKTREVDQITNSTSYVFQGISGKKLTGESAVTGRAVTELIVKKGNNYYQIETPPELFDEVLSTFKFIK